MQKCWCYKYSGLLPAATKLGQGNVFTGVCLSTGGVLPQCMLGYHHPPPGADPPGPGRHHPPRKQTPEYGLRAAGTHPTGMHSFYTCLSFCSQGGVVVSHKALRQTPPRPGTPPRPDTSPPQTRHTTPPDQAHHPPRPGTPPPQTMHTPPLDQTHHPPTRHTTPSPRPGTPPDEAPPHDQAPPPPDQAHPLPPGSRLRHTVYERPVRILLECILVEL